MELHPVETPLDKLSNCALDAIQARRFQQAEQLCKKLLRVYRKAPDGHERMGMLRMAEGRFQDALRHYDQLLQMAQKEPEHFGPEAEQYIAGLRSHAIAAMAESAGQATDLAADTATATSPDIAPRPGPVAAITAGIARLFRGK